MLSQLIRRYQIEARSAPKVAISAIRGPFIQNRSLATGKDNGNSSKGEGRERVSKIKYSSIKGGHGHGTCKKCNTPLQLASATNDPPILHCSTCKEFSFGSKRSMSSGPGDAMYETMSAIRDPPTPKDIVAYLDRYVISQEHAKRVMAVALYNHYSRLRAKAMNQTLIMAGEEEEPVLHEKSNVLLVGPSGTGKTLLAKTLANMLKVPFAICDATSMTEAGYVGEDVESVLQRLLDAADGNVARAQFGIVFLDEVDKISKQQARPDVGRDVGGEGVQQALLKMLEGTTVSIQDKRRSALGARENINFDTSNLLFILSGAFNGLEEQVKARLEQKSMGFGYAKNNCKSAIPRLDWAREVSASDLITFGMIPEFIGRVPIVAVLSSLDENALVRTLTEPRNSLIKQYQSLMALQGVKLDFTKGALHAIARESLKAATGARGLRSILERILLPVMFEAPTAGYSSVLIDEDVVVREHAPKVTLKKNPAVQANGTPRNSK